MSSSDSDASDSSALSHITVAVLPEDLDSACTAQCRPERCDNATVRPHESPPLERGTPGQFNPLDVPYRAATVRGLSTTPLELFQQYVPLRLVESWVQWTNEAAVRGPVQQHSRSSNWRPTSVDEVYLFLGILIYMGIHVESKISQYWSTSQNSEDPIHLFTRFISRNRFQILLRRLCIFDTANFSQPDSPPTKKRRRSEAQPHEDLMPKVYRQVNQWSSHIQEVGDSFYIPGSNLTVDEAMVRFTGRSIEKTTIPGKPTPVGYKVWVLAQSGYFIRWLWHVHGKGPYGLVPQQRSQRHQKKRDETSLTPTQRVVTTLLTLLPVAEYHVFLDNLFASVKLFRALRLNSIGATGTCRKDGGIDRLLVDEKEDEGRYIPWGEIHCIPTKDGQINQLSWKDNALVLFLTTVFRGTEEIIRSRRRPNKSSAAARAAREVFGTEARKNLPIPLCIDEYNHNMNGVDTGDQMRSYNQYGRPVRRGGWQSLAWNFLLEVVLVNSFLLQRWGEPGWARVNSQYEWRRSLSAQLIQHFGPLSNGRKYSRPQRATDKRNSSIPSEQHVRDRRKNPSACVACTQQKRALGETTGNSRSHRKKTRSGCLQCGVALCNSDDCWYLFHSQSI